jgi:hypothetical protein
VRLDFIRPGKPVENAGSYWRFIVELGPFGGRTVGHVMWVICPSRRARQRRGECFDGQVVDEPVTELK